MQINDYCSNEAIMEELGARMRRARIDFPLSQQELAERAGISKRTIMNIERGSDVTLDSLMRALRALGLLSRMDLLVDPDEPRPSQFLEDASPMRQRVSRKAVNGSSWKWGDEK